jgi:hypothetical protein
MENVNVNWRYDNKDWVVVTGASDYSEAEYAAEKFVEENAGPDYGLHLHKCENDPDSDFPDTYYFRTSRD